ncbi:MAG: ABC transporter permease [Acidobacteriaceae bacterium]|nr:ABC transporter permease [Acidobacteriaceae bacterium]
MLNDVRLALRQILKAPGFALAAILSLTLGIGANTAIFSVVNAVLRHPAGVDHPERVGMMYVRYKQFGLDVPYISVPDYADAASLKDEVEVAALESDTAYNVIHDSGIQHLSAAQVSWRWFQVFGASPILGRTFSPEEDQPGAAAVAVLSYGTWQGVFGGRRDVIGQTILLDQKPYRIVGVMRSDFDWPRGKQIWTPLALAPAAFSVKNRFNESYQTAVRLRPGISLERMNASFAARIGEELPREGNAAFAASSGWSVYGAHLTEYAAGTLRKPLYVLFAVVVLVLLIAAANVAGLFLARVSTRGREFAIRIALGANARAMTQQLLVETLLLAAAATAAGIAAGPVLGRLLLLAVPHNLAEGFTVKMEPAVLAFTAGAGLLTCLIAGIGPAARVIRQSRNLALHEGGRSVTASADKQRLRSAFVIGEVALAFLLLAGTGLFLISLQKLQQVNPGFNPHGVLAAKVAFSGADFKNSQPRQAAFVNAALANLCVQPGVRAAAAVAPLPFGDGKESSSFGVEGRAVGSNDPGPHSQVSLVTPDYLKVMQIPLVRGRWFTSGDRAGTAPVVVIDARLARRYWPGQDPIGQHLRTDTDLPWATIVGVVGNIRFDSLEDDTSDGMRYYPFAQQSSGRYANFVIRTGENPTSLMDRVKRATRMVDGTQTVSDIQTLDFLVSNSLAGRRLIVWMLAAFAAVALLLAIVGVYALISYLTAQRTIEVGVRMALGAQRSDVLAMVLKSSMTRVLTGLGIGVALSLTATALLQHFFGAIGRGAPPSLIFAALALLVAGGFAALIPAARAASISPIRALRNE